MMGWRLAAVHAGAQDYLVKSATDAALLARSLRYACERARLRRSLTEREARFRALVDQSQEAITLLDEHRVALLQQPSRRDSHRLLARGAERPELRPNRS